MKKLIILFLTCFGILVVTGCSGESETTSVDGAKLNVVATISQIADVVKNVGGDHVQVNSLMGPGVDPHLYKATQGDIKKLENADMILYNGLNLEGKMADVFVQMASDKPTHYVAEYVPTDSLREPPEFEGHYDPHVWFDIQLWMTAVEKIKDALIDADPTNEKDYSANAENYLNKLKELDTYAKEEISKIPEGSRVLVTAHDAFGYFGDAYGMEVLGLQGISTDAEYGVKDVQNLVNILVERNVKAVFVESSVSSKAIEAVVAGAKERGHEVVIGGELFSDAMGPEGTEEGTYIGMFRHNVETIVSSLK